jgi:hypothetical protein
MAVCELQLGVVENTRGGGGVLSCPWGTQRSDGMRRVDLEVTLI